MYMYMLLLLLILLSYYVIFIRHSVMLYQLINISLSLYIYIYISVAILAQVLNTHCLGTLLPLWEWGTGGVGVWGWAKSIAIWPERLPPPGGSLRPCTPPCVVSPLRPEHSLLLARRCLPGGAVFKKDASPSVC